MEKLGHFFLHNLVRLVETKMIAHLMTSSSFLAIFSSNFLNLQVEVEEQTASLSFSQPSADIFCDPFIVTFENFTMRGANFI